jgi:hypothetical protein
MRTFAMLTTAAAMTVALAAPGMAGTATRAVAQAKATAKAEGTAAAGAQEKSPSAPAAQDPAPSAPSSEQSAEKSVAAQGSIDAQAQADLEAKIEARKSLERIKERGAKVSAEARAKAESKLNAVATRTGEEAAQHGSATVAARLAAEFGMSTDQLMAQHQALGCSWGDLMIAHSLDANTTTEVTAAQLIDLRKEGTGWGQIAAGLGMKLGHVVSAVQAEGRVATGLSKPDGKVAGIRGDGVRAGVGAGASAATQAGGASATAQTGVGVGVKIKP